MAYEKMRDLLMGAVETGNFDFEACGIEYEALVRFLKIHASDFSIGTGDNSLEFKERLRHLARVAEAMVDPEEEPKKRVRRTLRMR